jgi:RNA polymerase sigma-70 factor, ECF subfamily
LKTFGKYDDPALFISIQGGSKDAFAELFGRYYNTLCCFGNLMIADRGTVEEIVQDLFVTIWLKRNEIKITTSIKAYLYMAVKNRSINHIRKKTGTPISEHLKEVLTNTDTPHNILEIKELDQQIQEAVNSLPERAKMVFILRYFRNEKQKDVARIMNISENTVEKHMMNALSQMRKKLVGQKATLKD